jgi:NAD(P)-dependent dehydrogenase (short-subunit alcohol dehydrogenase family)
MRNHLENKVALVTGASSGIGRATALILAREGAKVVVSDVREREGNETANEIKQRHGEALFIPADVSDADDVETLVERTVSAYGRLDCACNNAGVENSMKPTADISMKEWDKVLDINLKGVWLCMKYEIPEMLEHGGSIVNISSIAGQKGFANLAPYTASKFGIIGLTKTAALEYAKTGIRINAVCPGVIRTEMIDRVIGGDPDLEKQYVAMEPVGRMGKPEEIAESVLWLFSDASSFVTGHAMTVDGGIMAG